MCVCVSLSLSHSAEAVLLCGASSWGVDGWKLGRKRPVVLVGHQFAGDVIESLVMKAKGIVKNTRLRRSSLPYWGVMSAQRRLCGMWYKLLCMQHKGFMTIGN